MESHMRSHEQVKQFKCNLCEKTYYVLWRMKKHLESHEVVNKYCHYFNNKDSCPYDAVGCKFKHEVSMGCKYDERCRFKLCQFKHSKKYLKET